MVLLPLPTFTPYPKRKTTPLRSGKTMERETIIQLAGALLVLLFGYAALAKLSEWEEFLQQLALQPVAREAVTLFAWGIPAVELFCCLLLVWERTRLQGLYLALGLMVLFTGYVGLVLLGVWEEVPCSCGGVISPLGGK